MDPLISRKIFDNLSDEIIVIKIDDFTIVDANRSLLEALKSKREDVVGRTCYEVTHHRRIRCGGAHDICPISEMLKTGKPIVAEHTHFDKDSNPFYVEVSATPIKDKNGTITHAIHIAKNITARKTLEKDLLKFKLGVERAKEVVFLTEPDGTMVYVNPMFEKLYGFTREEALGKTPRILKSGTLPQEVYKQFWDTLLAGKIQAGEIVNKTKNGQLLTVDSSANPIMDEDRKIIGFLTIQRDITQQKQMAQEIKCYTKCLEQLVEQKVSELKDSEERFRSISNSAMDAIVLLNEKGFVSYWNPAAEKMFGYTKDEVSKIMLRDLIATETDSQCFLKGFENFLLTGQAGAIIEKPLELVAVRKDRSEFPVELSVSAFELGGKKHATGIIRDITERKKTEALALESARKLKDSERLVAIGTTAGMVAHDIRNPLQTIAGEVFLVKRELQNLPDGDTKETLKESIDIVAEQANYINKIVSDLQDFSKPLSPKLEELDIEKIIRAVLYSIGGIPKKIQVKHFVASNFPKLVADESYIRRILQNLSNNAVQAMPEGGKLTIKAKTDNGKAVITVQDTGGGIPEELRSKLFTPLVTTKSKGQGFGLAVIKRMTEALGGKVTFESQVEKGTKFIITLPLEAQLANH